MSQMKDTMADHYDQAWALGFNAAVDAMQDAIAKEFPKPTLGIQKVTRIAASLRVDTRNDA